LNLTLLLILVFLFSSGCTKARIEKCQNISNFQFTNIANCETQINGIKLNINNERLIIDNLTNTNVIGKTFILSDFETIDKLKKYNNSTQYIYLSTINGSIKQTLLAIFQNASYVKEKKILILNQKLLFQSLVGTINSVDSCPLRQIISMKVNGPINYAFSDEKARYQLLFQNNLKIIWIGGLNFNDFLSFYPGCEVLSSIGLNKTHNINDIKDFLTKTNHPLARADFYENIEKLNF
jgi:hypothetical protein